MRTKQSSCSTITQSRSCEQHSHVRVVKHEAISSFSMKKHCRRPEDEKMSLLPRRNNTVIVKDKAMTSLRRKKQCFHREAGSNIVVVKRVAMRCCQAGSIVAAVKQNAMVSL